MGPFWIVRLHMLMWRLIPHKCIPHDRVLIAGGLTICERCGKVIQRDV